MDHETIKSARILIVDDEPANVRLLQRLLQQGGYTGLTTTTDSRQVLPLFDQQEPDLLLLDLFMPHLDGFAILEQLRPRIPAGAYLPILVLTADITPEAKQRALSAGAKDFLTKPFDHTEVLLRIKNLLETRTLHLELRRQNESLEEQVRERTQRLLQSEKLATMGELLAGVAHELNNPLGIVMGHATLLAMQAQGGPLAERAQKITDAAERCARIVKNFLTMARQRPPERQVVHLNQVVRDTVEMLGYQLRVAKVEPAFSLADDLPALWADPHQLQQVMVNLVVNAQQAMGKTVQPRRIAFTTWRDPTANCVVLEVADTGPGIPPEIQARIFEPFFTTKSVGSGTGLGLSLCRGIVEGHRGTIGLESEPGKGARFRIELPVEAPPKPPQEARGAEAAPPIRGKTILVVDDEPLIGELLRDMLAADEHHVETVANGVLALEQLQQRAFDVIMCDMRMPDLDGPGLYRELERRNPGLLGRCIFVTGDTLNAQTREFFEATNVPRVGKPFSMQEVRSAVQRVLRSEGG